MFINELYTCENSTKKRYTSSSKNYINVEAQALRRNMEIKTMCAFENEHISFAICMKH